MSFDGLSRPPAAPRLAWMLPAGSEDRSFRAEVGAVRVGVRGWDVRRSRATVVHAFVPVEDLGGAAWACTLGGAAAVVVTPTGPPGPLPWWGARFQRLILPSQEEAHAWRRVGVHLGRLVVVEPGDGEVEALQAVYAEVASMGARPGLGALLGHRRGR